MEHPPIPEAIKRQGQEAFSAWASTEKISLIEASFQKIKPDIFAILKKYDCPVPKDIDHEPFWGLYSKSFYGTDEAAAEIQTLEGVDSVSEAFHK